MPKEMLWTRLLGARSRKTQGLLRFVLKPLRPSAVHGSKLLAGGPDLTQRHVGDPNHLYWLSQDLNSSVVEFYMDAIEMIQGLWKQK